MRRAAPGRRHGRWGPAGAWGRGGGSPGRPPGTCPQWCEVLGEGARHGRRASRVHTPGAGPGLQAGGRLKDGDRGAEASGATVEGFLNVKAEVWDGRAGWRTLQTVFGSPGGVEGLLGILGQRGRAGVLKLSRHRVSTKG